MGEVKNWTKKPEFHKKQAFWSLIKDLRIQRKQKDKKNWSFKKNGVTRYVKTNITVNDNTCSSAYVSGIWIPGAFALITTGKG